MRLDTFEKVEGERGEVPVGKGSIRQACSIKAGPAQQKPSPREVDRVGPNWGLPERKQMNPSRGRISLCRGGRWPGSPSCLPARTKHRGFPTPPQADPQVGGCLPPPRPKVLASKKLSISDSRAHPLSCIPLFYPPYPSGSEVA